MCLNLVQSTAASYFLRTVALGCELYLDVASMPISVPDSDRCNPDSSQVLSEKYCTSQHVHRMDARVPGEDWL